jgi:hypothetical protein
MKWNPLKEAGFDPMIDLDDDEVESDSRGQTKAEKELGIAKAKFATAIVNVKADEILLTYKNLEKYVKAYVKEISGGRY